MGKGSLLCVTLALLTSSAAIAEPMADAIALYTKGDYAGAVRAFSPLALQGNALAETFLGEMYVHGNGVPADPVQGVHWLTLAAAQGQAAAEADLGDAYYFGAGVSQGYAEALKYYNAAAQQGIDNAQNALGDMYFKGVGVTRDYTQALSWYQLAAKQGHANAVYSLGFMYYAGLGTAQNYPLALVWFQQGEKIGNIGSSTMLGGMYRAGFGVPQDYAEALKHFRLAAQNGGTAAAVSIGEMHFNGEGVPKDYVKAYMWENVAVAGETGDQQKEDQKERDQAANLLTPAQILQAQGMASRCQSSNFKDCGYEVSLPAEHIAPQPPKATRTQAISRARKVLVIGREAESECDWHRLLRQQQRAPNYCRACSGRLLRSAGVGGDLFKQVAVDSQSDLALLVSSREPSSFAHLQGGRGARLGEPIVAMGFPLHGILGADPIVTTGTISALAGLGNDRRNIQISAPVQPGNSGGPLVSEHGSIVRGRSWKT